MKSEECVKLRHEGMITSSMWTAWGDGAGAGCMVAMWESLSGAVEACI